MIEVLIFRVDQFSFWVGFAAGLIFAWLLVQARKAAPGFLRFLRQQITSARESLTTGTENRMRQDVLQWAQKQHLAAPLFSLNEIVVQPELMNPPRYTQPEEEFFQDITTQTIPYMPDWPELAAHYGAVTLTLSDALQNGANIVVIGHPGSGKTVALAHLASQIALRDPAAGKLTAFFPLFIPATALYTRLNAKNPIDALTQTMASCYASPITLPRLRNVLKYLMQSGRVLLLVDCLDELTPGMLDEIKNYLMLLYQEYPRLRFVVAASLGDFAKFQELHLTPLAMAAWTTEKKKAFVQKWQDLWTQYIAGDELSGGSFIDHLLLVQWLSQKEAANSPFEITLRTWGAFAGDLLGPGLPELIYAHLRRLTSEYPSAILALEGLAMAMIERLSPIMPQREAETTIAQYIKSQLAEKPAAAAETSAAVTPASNLKEGLSRTASPSQLVAAFLNNGILVSYGNSQLGFAHPFYLGYLAGRACTEANLQELTEKQPDWTGWFNTLGFCGYFGDITSIVERMLEEGKQTPVQRQSFQAARWLQIAHKKAAWRATLMRYLLDVLQRDYETLSSAGRALTALLLSNDPGVANLLRQLTKSNHPNIRQLAALGLGMVGDSKMADTLAVLVNDPTPGVMRAACLGLVALGTKNATDAVITVLLNYSEEARRAAAEALVNNRNEGIEILKEGISMEDLLVRRAVIYGMVRARDPELLAILEKTAIEDAQWVVRNAAGQALEALKSPRFNIPTPETVLIDQPWLINFAAKSGIGVSDLKQANALVLQALEYGEEHERLHALEHLRLHAYADAIPVLYHTYYGSQNVMREACYDVLWHFSASDLKLPPAIQFGLG